MWLQNLDEASASEPEPTSSHDETAIWFKKLKSSEEIPSQPAESAPSEDLPAWMQNLEDEDKMSETQFNIPIDEIASSTAAKESSELSEATEWMGDLKQESVPEPAAPTEEKTPELPRRYSELVERIGSRTGTGSHTDRHGCGSTCLAA